MGWRGTGNYLNAGAFKLERGEIHGNKKTTLPILRFAPSPKQGIPKDGDDGTSRAKALQELRAGIYNPFRRAAKAGGEGKERQEVGNSQILLY
jgi:hypothetical protein